MRCNFRRGQHTICIWRHIVDTSMNVCWLDPPPWTFLKKWIEKSNECSKSRGRRVRGLVRGSVRRWVNSWVFSECSRGYFCGKFEGVFVGKFVGKVFFADVNRKWSGKLRHVTLKRKKYPHPNPPKKYIFPFGDTKILFWDLPQHSLLIKPLLKARQGQRCVS